MAQENRTVEEILASWNTPPKDSGFDLVVGLPVPEGDGRATVSVDHNLLGPDAGNGDDGDEPVDYHSWVKADLQAEIAKRNEAREDEDDHIEAESNKNDDLANALVEDDEWLAEVAAEEAAAGGADEAGSND